MYATRGLPGQLYWYAANPVHAIVFRGMHQAILRQIKEHESTGTAPQTMIISN